MPGEGSGIGHTSNRGAGGEVVDRKDSVPSLPPEIHSVTDQDRYISPGEPAITSLREPITRVLSIEERRELWRGYIAGALLALLALLVIRSFFTLWFGWAESSELQDVLTLVFAPVVGLVGAVTGFYFGEKSTYRDR